MLIIRLVGSNKLQLDDLLAPLTSASDSVLALKKSAKTLTSARMGKTLSAPLPTRAQERLDREAAYEQTKEEVDKWNDTMKQIREVYTTYLRLVHSSYLSIGGASCFPFTNEADRKDLKSGSCVQVPGKSSASKFVLYTHSI